MNEDKAARYHRLKRRARVGGVTVGAGLLVLSLASGASAWLRDAAGWLASAAPVLARPGLTVALYVVVLFAAAEACALPVSAYDGFLLARQYGIGRQSFGGWLADSAKAAAVGLVLALGASALVYFALRLDETIIRLDQREMLEKSGFDVCGEAKDGEEAVMLARTLEPDLVLLDVKMPKLDGIDAARRILEERPVHCLPSVAVSTLQLGGERTLSDHVCKHQRTLG